MRLFISYAHTDIEQVKQLHDTLQGGGHNPWYDRDIHPGVHWKTEIEDAIKSSDAFVYTLSPESIASGWCQAEYILALQLKKPVFPVLLKETDIPPAIQDRQYADLDKPGDVARLLKSLDTLRQQKQRRWLLVRVLPVAALLAAIAIAAFLLLRPQPLVVADFNTCTNTNNLGQQTGEYASSEGDLQVSYIGLPQEQDCMARLAYDVEAWAALQVQLGSADLSGYRKLAFDINVEAPADDWKLKLELKRADGTEMAITYVPITRSGWQRITVDLADFAAVNFSRALSSRQAMEDLLITFDDNSGLSGVVYLDNIAFEP